MTDPHSPGGRKRRSIAVLLALGLTLTAASALVLPSVPASAAATDDRYGPTEAVKVTNTDGTPADDPTDRYPVSYTHLTLPTICSV